MPELSGVIRANGFARFARIGWFARIGNWSDSCQSAWRAIKTGVSIANDSRESGCESPVPLSARNFPERSCGDIFFRQARSRAKNWAKCWAKFSCFAGCAELHKKLVPKFPTIYHSLSCEWDVKISSPWASGVGGCQKIRCFRNRYWLTLTTHTLLMKGVDVHPLSLAWGFRMLEIRADNVP